MDVREITSATRLQPIPEVRPAAREITDAGAIADGASVRPDHADVSATAALLADAAKQPEVRGERVAALQQQLSQGTYNISPSSVADALLRSVGRG